MNRWTSLVIGIVSWLIAFVAWIEELPYVGVICFFFPLALEIYFVRKRK